MSTTIESLDILDDSNIFTVKSELEGDHKYNDSTLEESTLRTINFASIALSDNGCISFKCLICNKKTLIFDELINHIKQDFNKNDTFDCHVCYNNFDSINIYFQHLESSHLSDDVPARKNVMPIEMAEAQNDVIVQLVDSDKHNVKDNSNIYFQHFELTHLTDDVHPKDENPITLSITETEEAENDAVVQLVVSDKDHMLRNDYIEKDTEVHNIMDDNDLLTILQDSDSETDLIIDDKPTKSDESDIEGELMVEYLHDSVNDEIDNDAEENCTTVELSIKSMNKSDSEIVDKKYICDICGKGFAVKSYLAVHHAIHTNEKRFKCETCGKCFLQSNGLKAHIRYHLDERPFPCPQCPKKFRTSGHLTTHKKRHANYRPYECSHCDKKFFTPLNLKHHLLTHTGEKPYPCDICGTAFRTLYARTSHRRLHTGEKPYVCKICNKTFTQASGLSGHKRAYHYE